MPEGDTVWLAAQRLNGALAGAVLTSSDFRVPSLATANLVGQRVVEVVPRGKHLLTRLDSGLTLHTHFQMDGSWHLYRRGEKWRGGPAHQIRVVLGTDRWDAVGYRLPVVELVATGEESQVVGHLGPDLLGPDWDEDEAARRILAEPARTIGEALLDQRNVAGIGTLYRAETLFLARLHPRTPAADVPDLREVLSTARTLLQRNRKHPQQTTTGDLRRGFQHWVFGREGRPCRRCATPIRLEEFGPLAQERRSFWCPRCQPAAAASG